MAAISGSPRKLIGRDALVEDVVDRVRHERLVTLAGRRGVGKSRVAVAVAERLWEPWHLVPLDEARNRTEYAARVLAAVGPAEVADNSPETALFESLHEQPAGALVLDGCEDAQVAAPFVDALLEEVPGLQLLVTAPAALQLHAESLIEVPTLALAWTDEPARQDPRTSPAVALFVAAARRHAPGTVFSGADLTAVAEICRRLDGLPEAIVLAAARLAVLRPALLSELAEVAVAEVVGTCVEDEVGRTLELLEPGAWHVLLALAATSGGASPDAVGAIVEQPADAVAGALELLVQLHLAVVDRELCRFGLIPHVAAQARRRWVGTPLWAATARRQAAYFSQRTRSSPPTTSGGRVDVPWLLDHANRLAALATLRASGDAPAALQLVVACMVGFRYRAEPHSGRRLLAELLAEVPGAASEENVHAHVWLARLEAERCDGVRTRAAHAHFDAALRLARTRNDVALRLEVLHAMCEHHVLLEDGLVLCERAVDEGLRLARRSRRERDLAVFQCWHAANLHRRRQAETASEILADAIRVVRASADPRLVITFGTVHGQLPALGRRDVGAPTVPELLEMADELDDARLTGGVLDVAVNQALDEADYREAVEQALAMARLSRRTRQAPLARKVVVATVRLLARHPAPEVTAELAGALASHREQLATQLPPRCVDDLDRSVWLARGSAPAAFDSAHRRGEELSVWEGLELAQARLIALLHLQTAAPVWPSSAAQGHLTPREAEVLHALARGDPNKEIARRLGMRPRTVAHHCEAIYAKLGVRNRTEAVTEALRRGLVRVDDD